MNQDLLDSPEYYKQQLPLSDQAKAQIRTWREEICRILQGKDDRLLLIVGPCSIHNPESALEYAKKLTKLREEVKDHFFIIMRTYFEKPRTSIGWKGLLYDPFLDTTHNIQQGLTICRSLLLQLVELGMPAATEFVEPLACHYFQDLISWGSIGARTVQSPLHRELASSLEMAVGFKNHTCGDIEAAICACLAAKQPQTFLSINEKGALSIKKSLGNPFPHIILRGGKKSINYDRDSIKIAHQLLMRAHLESAIIVDASHDNSKKDHKKQAAIFSYLLHEKEAHQIPIRGIMLESFLLEATQQTLTANSPYSQEEIAYGASFTDPCLDWQSTQELIQNAFYEKNSPKVHV
jgi:3-deoxy-7-phosphoheptulonate synthase